MARWRVFWMAVSVSIVLISSAGASGGQRLVDRWRAPGLEAREYGTMLVVGITDDDRARRNFENKFVSQLRGRGVSAVTSYSIVADLETPGDREAVLAALEDKGVDGVITVRAVPLAETTEEAWGKEWKSGLEEDLRVRTLIERSLPIAEVNSKRFGIEVALWDMERRGRIWAGRTTPYTRKQMRKGAGDFVQFVMGALEYDKLM